VSGSSPKNPVISEVAYHDYVALLCFMDAEWSRRRPMWKDVKEDYSQFLRTERDFKDVCEGLRKRICKKHEEWYKANHNQKKPRSNDGMAPEILKPISYVSFGHADCLGIVLLDDLEAMHYITAKLAYSMEEVCLGFCPRC